jgi:microcystin-dependent protein
MPTQIPLNFRMAPIPADFAGTPQQFGEVLTGRLSAESAVNISFFVSGPTAPTSDYGPWLKNGLTWWTFDTVTGAYVPQPLEAQSLKYIASATSPSPTQYVFWIELDGTGKAQAIKYYSGGAWKDVYEDKFALYSTTTQMNAAIASAAARIPGEMIVFGGVTAPSGWLACDGSLVGRATYPSLFNAIGVTWGAGDGSTTFALPDLRGRTPVGIGIGDATNATSWTIAEKKGDEKHTLTIDEMPAHDHDVPATASDASGVGGIVNGLPNETGVPVATTSVGSGDPFNIIQPSLGALWIIKT